MARNQQQHEIDQLRQDLHQIRDNHLAHLKEDVNRIEAKVAEIDNRIWAILLLVLGSLLATLLT
jgi:polyhydroxyalkanoate synthesis regulator phasin